MVCRPRLNLWPFLSPIHTLQHQHLHLFWNLSIPDQASLIIWVKPILQFILVRKLNLEWLIMCKYTSHKLRDVYDYIILYHIY